MPLIESPDGKLTTHSFPHIFSKSLLGDRHTETTGGRHGSGPQGAQCWKAALGARWRCTQGVQHRDIKDRQFFQRGQRKLPGRDASQAEEEIARGTEEWRVFQAEGTANVEESANAKVQRQQRTRQRIQRGEGKGREDAGVGSRIQCGACWNTSDRPSQSLHGIKVSERRVAFRHSRNNTC